jgi:hypothetical protein
MEASIQVGAIAGIVSLVIHTVQQVIHLINHTKIKSKCCGKNLGETSIDIVNTTPTPTLAEV